MLLLLLLLQQQQQQQGRVAVTVLSDCIEYRLCPTNWRNDESDDFGVEQSMDSSLDNVIIASYLTYLPTIYLPQSYPGNDLVTADRVPKSGAVKSESDHSHHPMSQSVLSSDLACIFQPSRAAVFTDAHTTTSNF